MSPTTRELEEAQKRFNKRMKNRVMNKTNITIATSEAIKKIMRLDKLAQDFSCERTPRIQLKRPVKKAIRQDGTLQR